MDCDACRQALSAALDGETGAGERAQVEAHLVGCRACRAHQAALHRLHRRLRLRAAEAVPDLTARILDALPPVGAATSPARRGSPRGPWWAVAAALVAVLAGLGALGLATYVRGEGADSSQALVEVTDVYATPARPGGLSSVYLTLRNRGQDEDALVQVETEVAGLVELHATVTDAAGLAVMRTVDEFPLGPRSSGTVRAGRSHVMLVDVSRSLRPGDQLPLVLHFGHAPAVHLEAPVVDEDTALARGAGVRSD